ncbi:MAG: molecular chaperone TorD family protein [Nitrospiraceae bacterium]|nr:molecular chaperone TorD family protein [Nitrospiraceae bacterium]
MAYSGHDERSQRVVLYKIFASVFLEEPSDEAISGVADLFGFADTSSGSRIRDEFNSIFFNPGTPLQPYESLHNYNHAKGPGLFSEPAADAQQYYAEAGLVMDEDINLPPDHISAELFFMAYLIELDMVDMQRCFMQDHLVKWIPEYCTMVKEAAGTAFYREAASLLRLFILDDLASMSRFC